MTPLQLIKDGILQNDMNLVKEGYKLLTGESLDVWLDTEELVKNIYKTDSKPPVKNKRKSAKKVTTKKVTKKASRPKKTSESPKQQAVKIRDVDTLLEELNDVVRSDKKITFRNNFVDFGIKDALDEKITYPNTKTRGRTPVKMYSVTCVCGKVDKLPLVLAGPYIRGDSSERMTYYCGQCSKRRRT